MPDTILTGQYKPATVEQVKEIARKHRDENERLKATLDNIKVLIEAHCDGKQPKYGTIYAIRELLNGED